MLASRSKVIRLTNTIVKNMNKMTAHAKLTSANLHQSFPRSSGSEYNRLICTSVQGVPTNKQTVSKRPRLRLHGIMKRLCKDTQILFIQCYKGLGLLGGTNFRSKDRGLESLAPMDFSTRIIVLNPH